MRNFIEERIFLESNFCFENEFLSFFFFAQDSFCLCDKSNLIKQTFITEFDEYVGINNAISYFGKKPTTKTLI